MLVIDASVAVAWFSEDERSSYADSALQWVSEHGAATTYLWLYEIANALYSASRSRRMSEMRVAEAIEELLSLRINFDRIPEGRSAYNAVNRIVSLAREQKLTVYDAAYLDVARAQGPLATLDADLATAARRLKLYWRPGLKL